MPRRILLSTALAIQIAIPLAALAHGVPSRFGFHMFARDVALVVEVRDVDGRQIDVDLNRWMVGRPELDWATILPAQICSDVPAAAVVTVGSNKTQIHRCDS